MSTTDVRIRRNARPSVAATLRGIGFGYVVPTWARFAARNCTVALKDDNTGQLERQIITDLSDPEIDAAKAYEAQWSALTKGQIEVTRIQFESDRYVLVDGKPVHPTKQTHAMAVINELPQTTREEVFYALSFALRWRDAAQYACPSRHFDEADDLVQKLRAEYNRLP